MRKLTTVSYKTLCGIFERAGFAHVRIEGDHLVYIKSGCIRPVVIPRYKSIPIFIIKNNLRSAGMSREEYFKYLEQC